MSPSQKRKIKEVAKNGITGFPLGGVSVLGKLFINFFLFTFFPIAAGGTLIYQSYSRFISGREKEIAEVMGVEFVVIMHSMIEQTLLILILSITLSLVGVAVVAQSLIEPLKKLEEGVEGVRRGDLRSKIKIKTRDEIGRLSACFNQVVDLFRKQAFLEEEKEVLEIRVQARTRELQEMNQRLEKEVQKRTKEMKRKMEEYETINKLMVGRELKMVKLKKQLAKAKKIIRRMEEEKERQEEDSK